MMLFTAARLIVVSLDCGSFMLVHWLPFVFNYFLRSCCSTCHTPTMNQVAIEVAPSSVPTLQKDTKGLHGWSSNHRSLYISLLTLLESAQTPGPRSSFHLYMVALTETTTHHPRLQILQHSPTFRAGVAGGPCGEVVLRRMWTMILIPGTPSTTLCKVHLHALHTELFAFGQRSYATNVSSTNRFRIFLLKTTLKIHRHYAFSPTTVALTSKTSELIEGFMQTHLFLKTPNSLSNP